MACRKSWVLAIEHADDLAGVEIAKRHHARFGEAEFL